MLFIIMCNCIASIQNMFYILINEILMCVGVSLCVLGVRGGSQMEEDGVEYSDCNTQ